MAAVFVGIDTSCYTTSLAVCNIAGDILVSRKILLPVGKNQKGLRQSEAVFLHIKNLQELLNTNDLAAFGEIKAVAASGAPRPVEGSYMPVFQVSKCIATAVSSATGAFFIETTHQHAHIAAALIGNHLKDDFAALHLSGGTSEILVVRDWKGGGPSVDIEGRTLDIPAGQLIDRVGQRLGFMFPCGPFLEVCAQKAKGTVAFKTSVRETDFHFSGVEAQALRALDAGEQPQEVCAALQVSVARTVAQPLARVCAKKEVSKALLFGGVISNESIREEIRKDPECKGLELHFAKKKYAADNAAGLAVMAKDLYRKKEEL